MTPDPIEARLKIMTALKEEFMDVVDDGTTEKDQLVALDAQMTDLASDIMDAFQIEVIGSPGADIYDVRLVIPKYTD